MYECFFFLLALLILPSVSAVTLTSGTVLNTTGSNSSMTFNTCTLEADAVNIESGAITIYNASFTDATLVGLYTFNEMINHTADNTNYNCAEIGDALGDYQEIDAICRDADLSFLDAAAVAGILLTIILIGGAIIALVLVFSGRLNFNTSNMGITLQDIILGVLAVGVTFLIIATMSFLLNRSYC